MASNEPKCDAPCEAVIDRLEAGLHLRPADRELYYRLGICYSGGCRSHGMVDPGMAQGYLRHALALADRPDSLFSARVMGALGNVCCLAGQFRAGIECHRAAAEIYRCRERPADWAREHYNLGNSFCDAPEEDFPDKWEQAAAHYERALTVRTREQDPERYAATLENLGTAYRRLGKVLEAIGCYRRALRVFTSRFPARNAALHNNLGNAYLSLGGARNARRALRHLDRALRAPAEYAIAQYNRGHALLRLASIQEAAACFQEARRVFSRSGDWRHAALAQKMLAGLRLTPRR